MGLIGVSRLLASLGESADRIEGPTDTMVERHLLDDGTVSVLYHKGRYLCFVIFDQGVSVLERYSRVDRAELSEKEMAKFLKANAARATWTRHDSPQERRFERSDHKAEATYRKLEGRPTLEVKMVRRDERR